MYEIPIPSLKWIQDVESMRKILEGINDPYWKEDFIKEVRRQSRRFSTHKQLLDYYTYQVNPKTDVPGYREPTPNTVKDPSTRSYPNGYNQRSGRDDGGSQAGARQDTMTAQMAGLEVNNSPTYPGQHYRLDENSGSGYDYPSGQTRNGTSYQAGPTISGNRNRFDNDTYPHGDDEGYSSEPNHPQSTSYSNGSASQRGSAYNGYGQANRSSRRSRG